MNDNNCSADIRRYHDTYVKLSPETRKQLRGHRNANRDRLKDSLKEEEGPTPLRFQKQGSYAMHTTVQHPNNDYDIDDGVILVRWRRGRWWGTHFRMIALRESPRC